jgi:hypothetical protein
MMRRLTNSTADSWTISMILIFLLVVGCFFTREGVAKDETVDELKSRFESARPEDRVDLAIRIAELQLRSADSLYNNGNNDQARAAIDDVIAYSDKARDSATQTEKHIKNVEIHARKMAEKLRDIKRTLSFEDQPPLDQAIRRLEEIRTALLKEMFTNDHKKGKK